jgi:hypothetical protein
MKIMTLTPQEIRQFAKSLPKDQDRAEVRVGAAVITGLFLYKFIIEPLFSLMTLPGSLLSITAKMGHSEYWVIAALVTCSALVLPHMAALLFAPSTLHQRWPRKMAARGAVLAAVTWACLGANAIPLDVDGPVAVFYWINAFICAVVGGVYGFSLNSQQLRHFSQQHDEDTARY